MHVRKKIEQCSNGDAAQRRSHGEDTSKPPARPLRKTLTVGRLQTDLILLRNYIDKPRSFAEAIGMSALCQMR